MNLKFPVFKAEKINMGGIMIDQALPVKGIESVDPFLLIHHWSDIFPGGQHQMDLGVPPHPHRGFSPVTLVFKGSVHHRDSLGNDSIVSSGGTQWMNSGRGLVHSERPGIKLAEEGGEFELIQIWVNTPARHKMDEPCYMALHSKETPTVRSADGLVETAIVAGSMAGVQSPAPLLSPLLILRVEGKKGGNEVIELNPAFNTMIYILDGDVQLGEKLELTTRESAILAPSTPMMKLSFHSETRMICLSGKPLNERVANYGPFVMNNQKELVQAVDDYQRGKMGHLDEEI
jgi:redox-sensitive bicupin YhaK (pirin superfamily)